jgi:glycerol-3-phosphate acyltransferase PlsY
LLSFMAIIAGYLLGSISFSYLFGKWLKGIDIREHGSGNAGATNTLRVLGKGPAILVLILDALKGVLAVYLAKWLGGEEWVIVASGLSAIIGHNWPLFFGFRGGKGIASTVGVMASLCFLPTLFVGLLAILLIVITRYVSLGSLLLTVILPFFIWFMGRPIEVFWASIVVCLLAFLKHRNNISKLLQGKENKIGSKKA